MTVFAKTRGCDSLAQFGGHVSRLNVHDEAERVQAVADARRTLAVHFEVFLLLEDLAVERVSQPAFVTGRLRSGGGQGVAERSRDRRGREKGSSSAWRPAGPRWDPGSERLPRSFI